MLCYIFLAVFVVVFAIDHLADVNITDCEVSNWLTFWFRWVYNSDTQDDQSTYEAWYRNRYLLREISIPFYKQRAILLGFVLTVIVKPTSQVSVCYRKTV